MFYLHWRWRRDVPNPALVWTLGPLSGKNLGKKPVCGTCRRLLLCIEGKKVSNDLANQASNQSKASRLQFYWSGSEASQCAYSQWRCVWPAPTYPLTHPKRIPSLPRSEPGGHSLRWPRCQLTAANRPHGLSIPCIPDSTDHRRTKYHRYP